MSNEKGLEAGSDAVASSGGEAFCCFFIRHEVNHGVRCEESPEFVIYDSGDPSPEAYTHSCTKHVGKLLGHLDSAPADARDEWLVLPL